MPSRRSFVVLDGLRGIAAISVLIVHLSGRPAHFLPRAYLAVDFFFVLSGFVLSEAYTERPIGFFEFMRIRMIRLYPLYLMGLLLGVGATALTTPLTAPLLYSLGLNVFFLPSFVSFPGFSDMTIYPFDGPAWSLLFEIGVNAVWFVALPLLTSRLMMLTVASCALLITGLIVIHGDSNVGTMQSQLFAGMCRVLYSFFTGVAINRVWHATSFRVRLPTWLIALALLVAFMMPIGGTKFDVIAVLAVFPSLLFLGACASLPGTAERAAAYLGRASYAIYILHFPMIILVEVSLRPWLTGFSHPGDISLPAVCAVLAALVWFADRFYDVPVRAWLSRRSRLTANMRSARIVVKKT